MSMLMLIIKNPWQLASGVAIAMLDFIMAVSLIAGYNSVFSIFLPFRTKLQASQSHNIP